MYPAIYRWAYAAGREKDLLTEEQQKIIPKQTKWNWRNVSKDDVFHLEQELLIRDQLDTLIEKEDLDWFKKKRLFLNIAKLHFSTINLLGKENYERLLSLKKEDFVKMIEQFSSFFPKQSLLKWFHINSAKYQMWLTQTKFDCQSSKLKLCAKQHPHQITKSEYHIIEASLNDPIFSCWPKSSIHSELFKRGALSISRSTFYKHARLIMPVFHQKIGKRQKLQGLRADYVNEYWHMDISYFKTGDGKRSYVYAIIDNYSRKIITWRCEQNIRKIKIGKLIIKALEIVTLKKLKLVSDGGTENVNNYIESLLKEYHDLHDIDIDHKIALKTIHYSNSMIERFFRIMKSGYLYLDIPVSHKELCLALEKIIHEYNDIRPHYALNHLTPSEAHAGILPPNSKLQLSKARNQRFKKNKNCSCKVCDCV